ncbi:hypothetical protein HKCCE2091_04360 [Rhodobacterales bacterium HKCCE2091]|nr:hypothetical protein [Rhodobacterales bacterium HKCCE2091]
MDQAIPAYVINLARRPDRLERIAEHLSSRNIHFETVIACDATEAAPEILDAVIPEGGPLGALGQGDRACTVSHTYAWKAFLRSGAGYGLILEDDVWLSEDVSECLGRTDWIPSDLIKLEKFGDGASKLLLGAEVGRTPTGRSIRPLLSRHAGGGAYILSREAAEEALKWRGSFQVPVDHALFNANVSPLARRLRPAMVVPAMATQRQWAYNSDIAKHGKAARPKGLALKWRKLKRAWFEVNRAPQQALVLATGRARVEAVEFLERP